MSNNSLKVTEKLIINYTIIHEHRDIKRREYIIENILKAILGTSIIIKQL